MLDTLTNEAPRDVRIFPRRRIRRECPSARSTSAVEHRGRPTHIEPDERIDERISTFFARMQSPRSRMSAHPGSARPLTSTSQHYPTSTCRHPTLSPGAMKEAARRRSPSQVGSTTAQLHWRDVLFSLHDGEAFIPVRGPPVIGYLLTQIRIRGEDSEWPRPLSSWSLKYGTITPTQAS